MTSGHSEFESSGSVLIASSGLHLHLICNDDPGSSEGTKESGSLTVATGDAFSLSGIILSQGPRSMMM